MQLETGNIHNNTPAVRRGLLRIFDRIERAVLDELLCEDEQQALNKLLDVWRVSAPIEGLFGTVENWVDTLKAHGSLSLGVGWSGLPAGHAVNLVLHAVRKPNGIWYVSGRLINRGDGVTHHASTTEGGKRRYIDHLDLKEVPLEDLVESKFLEGLRDLTSSVLMPVDEKLAILNNTERAQYSDQDLYQVVLPLWRGITAPKSGVFRTPQRGPTCSSKSLVVEIKDALGESAGRCVKLLLQLQSVKEYAESTLLSVRTYPYVKESIEKMHRSILKLRGDERFVKVADNISNELHDLSQMMDNTRLSPQAISIDNINKGVFSSYARYKEKVKKADAPAMVHNQLIELSIDPSNITMTFSDGVRTVQNLFEHDRWIDARLLAIGLLDSLPTVLDSYWSQDHSDEVLRGLIPLLDILFATAGVHGKELHYTPNVVSLMLKAFAISLKQFSVLEGVSAIAERYATDAMGLISVLLYNGQKNSSYRRMKDYAESLEVIRSFLGTDPNSVRRNDDGYLSWGHYSRIISERYLPAAIDPEINFIIEKAQTACTTLGELDGIIQDHERLPASYACMRHAYYIMGLAMVAEKEVKHEKEVLSISYSHEYLGNSLPQHRIDNQEISLTVTLKNGPFISDNELIAGRPRHVWYGRYSLIPMKPQPIEREEAPTELMQISKSWFLGRYREQFLIKNISNAIVELFNAYRMGCKDDILLRPGIDNTQNHQLCLETSFLTELGQYNEKPLSKVEAHDLRSILLLDDLFIPQLVYYWENYSWRLRSPIFLGILAALLYTKSRDTDEMLVGKAAFQHIDQKGNPYQKNLLWNFFNSAIKESRKQELVETELYLLRLQTQVLACWDGYRISTEKDWRVIENQVAHFVNRIGVGTAHDSALICYYLISLMPYVLNRPVVRSSCTEALKKWVGEGHFIQTSVAQVEEDFFMGRAILTAALGNEGQELASALPSAILQSSDYRAVYGQRSFLAKETNKGWAFKNHLDRQCYAVISADGDVSHYQTLSLPGREDETLFKYCADYPFTTVAYNCKLLKESCHCWISTADELVVFLDRGNNELRYQISEGLITEPSRSLTRRLVSPLHFQRGLQETIARIAVEEDLLFWADRGVNKDLQITDVEIPPFDMQFNYRKAAQSQASYWYCSKIPGYYLDARQEVEDLVSYSHYLLLRDETGKRKVIISNLDYNCLEPSLANPPCLDQYRELPIRGTGNKLLTYDVSREGKIVIPFDPYHCLYLAYLAMMRQDYPYTQRLLSHLAQESSSWDSSAMGLAELFSQHSRGDTHPAACALRIRLAILLSSLSHEKLDLDAIKKDYKIYQQMPNNTFICPLKAEEIALVEKNVSKTGKEIAQKLVISAFEYFEDGDENRKIKKGSYSSTYWISVEMIEIMQQHAENPLQITSRLRPGAPFIANFFYYYRIARDSKRNSPEYRDLCRLLQLSRLTKDSYVASIHALLVYVAYSSIRSTFPSYKALAGAEGEQAIKIIHKLSSDAGKVTFPKDWFLPDLGTSNPVTDVPVESLGPAPLLPTKTTLSMKVAPAALHPPVVDHIKELRTRNLVFEDTAEYRSDLEGKINKIRIMIGRYHQKKAHWKNRSIQREFDRTIEGLEKEGSTLQKKLDGLNEHYALDPLKLGEFYDVLIDQQSRFSGESKDYEAQILKIMGDFPSTAARLEKKGGLLPQYTIKDLIVLYGQSTFEKVLEFNPFLSADQVQELHNLMGNYLLAKTDEQVVTRAISALQDKVPGDNTILPPLLEALTASRAYERAHEEPAILAFECLTNIRLRKEQYDVLKELQSEPIKDLELEARTGFGKSKVLIPLWLVLTRQKSEVMTMMAVPTPLFQDQLIHLRQILGRSMDIHITSLRFDRRKAGDIRYLNKIQGMMEEAQKSGKILLTDIHSLHGLTNLKLKEAFYIGDSVVDIQEALIDIRRKCARSVHIFFDESRHCFNIRHRYDYAIGDPEAIPAKKIQSIATLYDSLIFDKEVLEKWNFDFLPRYVRSHKKEVTELSYINELLPLFADRVATHFEVAEEHREAVVNNLKGGGSEGCKEFYDTLSDEKLLVYS